MVCKACGKEINDKAVMCPGCGNSTGVTTPANISNYLVPAILVTIFCCLPLGIPAIVYAAQVNTKIAAGDIAGAQKSSSSAKMWTWIAFGCGLVGTILYLGLVILGALSGALQQ
jgi:hypothetical protein